jgi:hypothetical protein
MILATLWSQKLCHRLVAQLQLHSFRFSSISSQCKKGRKVDRYSNAPGLQRNAVWLVPGGAGVRARSETLSDPEIDEGEVEGPLARKTYRSYKSREPGAPDTRVVRVVGWEPD